MELFGIQINIKNTPKLDPDFIPILKFNKAFLLEAKVPVSISAERSDGQMARIDTFVHGTPEMQRADHYYIDRLVKTILWMKGGYKIYVSGSDDIYDYLKNTFCHGGSRDFDFHFMSDIFEKDFSVEKTDKVPESKDCPKHLGGHMDGCRIGFDAGGSDRKVSAIIDGESVFSEEVVWHPKTNTDPDYHYEGIVSAFKSAAKHMPRVDAVGISSAGIFINNRTMRASLFLQVPTDLFNKKIKDIYIRAVKDTFGDIPFEVCNDGDVSALAGRISIGEPNVLGIAMGTSEAAGFLDENDCITGWLNELAFVPVDCSQNAMEDEWSLDIGCGVKYFSQDGVIKLAKAAGIELDPSLTPGEKLKEIQKLMANGDTGAHDIYLTIGAYLGHTLAYYYDLYKCHHVLLLGRVMSGKGGDIILEEAKRLLSDEYPEICDRIHPTLPDEKFRRVGQSAAAASLPEI